MKKRTDRVFVLPALLRHALPSRAIARIPGVDRSIAILRTVVEVCILAFERITSSTVSKCQRWSYVFVYTHTRLLVAFFVILGGAVLSESWRRVSAALRDGGPCVAFKLAGRVFDAHVVCRVASKLCRWRTAPCKAGSSGWEGAPRVCNALILVALVLLFSVAWRMQKQTSIIEHVSA